MLKNIQKWNENFGPFPPETKLVTIDVVGLYTNTPHEDLVNAIKEDLNKNPLDSIPKTDLVLKATDHVLKTMYLLSKENTMNRYMEQLWEHQWHPQ